MFKKLIAEFVATMILVLVGCGVAIGVGCGDTGGIVATAAAFGVSILILAYSVGQISGGHANPAVSLAMAIRGDITWKEFACYACAQVLGAFAGSGILALIFLSVQATGSNGFGVALFMAAQTTELNFGVVMLGLLAEVVLTFLFILAVLGVTSKKEWGGIAGIVIGISLFGVHLLGIPLTGTSVNPARALSALVLHMFSGESVSSDALALIACVIGPFIGAALAAFLWKFISKKKEA
jgi:aquaporin Z